MGKCYPPASQKGDVEAIIQLLALLEMKRKRIDIPVGYQPSQLGVAVASEEFDLVRHVDHIQHLLREVWRRREKKKFICRAASAGFISPREGYAATFFFFFFPSVALTAGPRATPAESCRAGKL
jgi:hypothetical protein